MYINSLKELYYQERKKLQDMWIYKQESKIRILQLRKKITEKIEENLTTSQLMARNDIAEETKDHILHDGNNEEAFRSRINKNLDDEISEIETAESDELRSANYRPDEYADYLYQMEKVAALEDSISEERLFPEDVWNEMKNRNQQNAP